MSYTFHLRIRHSQEFTYVVIRFGVWCWVGRLRILRCGVWWVRWFRVLRWGIRRISGFRVVRRRRIGWFWIVGRFRVVRLVRSQGDDYQSGEDKELEGKQKNLNPFLLTFNTLFINISKAKSKATFAKCNSLSCWLEKIACVCDRPDVNALMILQQILFSIYTPTRSAAPPRSQKMGGVANAQRFRCIPC